MRPGFHRSDRRVFADASGYDDEWDIELGLLQQLKRFRSTKLRQVVIGQNNFPVDRIECRAHLGGSLHSPEFRLEPSRFQQPHQHSSVEFRVLHHQHTQRPFLGRGLGGLVRGVAHDCFAWPS